MSAKTNPAWMRSIASQWRLIEALSFVNVIIGAALGEWAIVAGFSVATLGALVSARGWERPL